jgi:hypothetical protein
MVRLEEHGYAVILHVHDEKVSASEVSEDFGPLKEFMGVMATPRRRHGRPAVRSQHEASDIRRYKKLTNKTTANSPPRPVKR